MQPKKDENYYNLSSRRPTITTTQTTENQHYHYYNQNTNNDNINNENNNDNNDVNNNNNNSNNNNVNNMTDNKIDSTKDIDNHQGHDDDDDGDNNIIINNPNLDFSTTFALCWCTLTHAWLLISVFPYSGFMAIFLIQDNTITEENAGTRAGLIASSFMVGRFLSSYGWGKIADWYGRKFVLISSLGLSMVFSILFGLATNFRLALLWRFLLGLSNGILGTAKTVVSEAAFGNHDLESKSMSLVMGMWGWGFIASPALSGILVEPIRQYPNANIPKLFIGPLTKFPFLLPNLLSAIFCIIGMLAVRYAVPETLSYPRSLKFLPYDITVLFKDTILKRFQLWFFDSWYSKTTQTETTIIKTTTNTTTKSQHFEQLKLVGGDHDTNDDDHDDDDDHAYQDDESIVRTQQSVLETTSNDPNSNDDMPQGIDNTTSTTALIDNPSSSTTTVATTTNASLLQQDSLPHKEATVMSLWSQKSTRNHLLVTWVYSFVAMALEEAFPLYCLSRKSGLSLSEATIGKVLSASGILYIIFQYPVHSFLSDKFGLQWTAFLGALFSAPLLVLIPFAGYLNSSDVYPSSSTQVGGLTWSAFIYLSILLSIYRVFNLCFFSSMAVLTNHTVIITSHRGTMNGLSMFGESFTKALGPIFGGYLVSFSTPYGIYISGLGGGIMIFAILGLLGNITVIMILVLLGTPSSSSSSRNKQQEEDGITMTEQQKIVIHE